MNPAKLAQKKINELSKKLKHETNPDVRSEILHEIRRQKLQINAFYINHPEQRQKDKKKRLLKERKEKNKLGYGLKPLKDLPVREKSVNVRSSWDTVIENANKDYSPIFHIPMGGQNKK